MPLTGAQFKRVARRSGPLVSLSFDGAVLTATAGDSVLATLLSHGRFVRHHEFGGEPRAGFCLMGACQDCWVETETGQRLRACSTVLAPGMRLRTRAASTP